MAFLRRGIFFFATLKKKNLERALGSKGPRFQERTDPLLLNSRACEREREGEGAIPRFKQRMMLFRIITIIINIASATPLKGLKVTRRKKAEANSPRETPAVTPSPSRFSSRAVALQETAEN